MPRIDIDFANNILKKDGFIIDPSSINLMDEKTTIWCVDNKVVKSGERGRPYGEYYRALSYFSIPQVKKVEKSNAVGDTSVKEEKIKKSVVPKERPCVDYTPSNKYRFEIVNDVAHLYINDVELEITEKNILGIEAFEMYFGVLPAVVEFVYPFMDVSKFLKVPPIFTKKWVPKIYTDGTRSNIGNTTISLLIMILFFKRVCRSEFVQLCGKTFYLEHSNDNAHCFRNHTDNSLLYILQNSKNNFKSHGYSEKYTDGSYILYSISEARPVEIADRSKKLSEDEFIKICGDYNFCCALCGNLQSDSCKLEQGHIDPHFPLTAPGNCAPHCDSCNQTNKNNMTIKEFINPLKKRKLAYFLQHQYVKSLYTPEEFLEQQKKDFAKIFPDHKISS